MDIKKITDLNDKSGKLFKEKYIKKYYINLYNNIINYSKKYNFENLNFKEKMYYYYNNIKEIKRCKCGNNLTFISFTKGYSKYCSKKCTYYKKIIN